MNFPFFQNGSIHLPVAIISSMHTNAKILKNYADKGYAGVPNRGFLALNKIKDGIMRKDSKTAKLTESEIERNKAISKLRYIVEQYFGISHLHDNGKRGSIPKNLEEYHRYNVPAVCFQFKEGGKDTKCYSCIDG